jgi:hypothetical protein
MSKNANESSKGSIQIIDENEIVQLPKLCMKDERQE